MTENSDEKLLNLYHQYWLEFSRGSEYLNNLFNLFHHLYKKDAVTSLPISSVTPIIIIAMGDAENISASPTIEKYAATADIANADSKSIIANIIALREFYVFYIELCRYNNLLFLELFYPSVP